MSIPHILSRKYPAKTKNQKTNPSQNVIIQNINSIFDCSSNNKRIYLYTPSSATATFIVHIFAMKYFIFIIHCFSLNEFSKWITILSSFMWMFGLVGTSCVPIIVRFTSYLLFKCRRRVLNLLLFLLLLLLLFVPFQIM